MYMYDMNIHTRIRVVGATVRIYSGLCGHVIVKDNLMSRGFSETMLRDKLPVMAAVAVRKKSRKH